MIDPTLPAAGALILACGAYLWFTGQKGLGMACCALAALVGAVSIA